MILTGKQIREANIITPYSERAVFNGMSYGEGYAGYDIRIVNGVEVKAGQTALAVSLEHFDMPKNVLAVVHDKSTWARQGIFVNNTVLEPGWRGYLTIEIAYHPIDPLFTFRYLEPGTPIAQLIFSQVAGETDGYRGKYQDQIQAPIGALFE